MAAIPAAPKQRPDAAACRERHQQDDRQADGREVRDEIAIAKGAARRAIQAEILALHAIGLRQRRARRR